MKLECVLTVAQSKRLIALGLKHHPVVKDAFHNGAIVICRGTTTSYVAEEFLGRRLEHFSYTTGLTLPPAPLPPLTKPGGVMHDVIIRKGEVFMTSETTADACANLNSGDVIIKGANALNYSTGMAGCLIGHPSGGTVGSFWGPLYGRKARLVIPVSLEKEIAGDITTVAEYTLEENPGNSLMPMTGIIITEIEAIELLTGTQAVQIAAGGIRGAEGAVRLLVAGDAAGIGALKGILKEIELESPF